MPKPASPAVAGFAPAALTLAVAAAFLASPVVAQPSGAQAIHGQAALSRQGANLLVTTQNGTGTNHSAINWQSFSVPGGSTTHFQQPGAASLSINRVVGSNPSAIFGTLSSNGRLVLVNPSGIAVGAGAVVDTAGFTASTLRMSEADALAGRLVFGGDGLASGTLSVDGKILARSGDVVLIAPNVQVGTSALVQSPSGATLLAAGQKVELTGRGLEGIRMELQAPSDQALNLGTLQGDAVGIFAGQLKHSGLIQASAVTAEGGKVVLKGVDSADISGRVTASKGEQGGQVHATAGKVMLRSGAVIDVSGERGGGEALIGGGWQGNDSRIANAQATTVETGATIKASATDTGNGGTVVVWSDDVTRVGAHIEARGGPNGGDGGSVETSGKGTLVFRASVDTSAPRGKAGSLLLDPLDITIVGGSGGADDGLLADSVIGAGEPNPATNVTISEQMLEGLSGNVTLQASRDVILGNLPDDALDLTNVTGGSTFTITAGRDILGVSDVNDRFATGGGAISMTATGGSINIGGVRSRGGAVTLTAGGNLVVREIVTTPTSPGSGGAINLTSGGIMSLGGGHIDARFNGSGLSGNVVMASSGPIYMQALKTIYANTLKMSAVGGIGDGASGALAFDAAQISAGNSGSGDVKLSFTGAGGVSVTDLGFGFGLQNSAAGGVIALTATQFPLTVASAVNASGNITLTGTAGPSAPPGNAGTKIGSGTAVTSTGGNITLGGTFNNPSATSGTGLLVEGQVQSGPAGQITLNGSATVGGGAGTGVDIASTAVLTAGLGGLTVTGSVSSSTTATALVSTSFSGNASSSGNIAITGAASAPTASGVTGVSMGGSLTASGAATITITGSGVPAPAPASSYDVNIAGTTVGSAGGEIKLVGDRMNISSPINSGAGRTMIVPFTASRSIRLAGASGSEPTALNLNAVELNLITASTLVIGGSSYTGGISIGNTGGAINLIGTSSLSLINGAGGSITQTAPLTVSKLNADAPVVSLINAGNQVDQISGRSTTGAFQFVNNKPALTVGTVDGIAGIASSGSSVLVQNTGDIALAQAVAGTGSGNTVVLAGQHFSNTFGAGAINPGGGRWLVYSTTPSSNTFGGLVSGNNAVWNASYALNPPETIPLGNHYVFSAQPTVNVTAAAQTKVYDATAGFAAPSFTTSGLVDASVYGGVFLQDTFTGALSVSSPAKDVGSYSIVQGSLGAPTGYLFGTYTGANATVTPASLTVTGVTADNKVYDITMTAALSGTAAVTALGSDSVAVSGTGAGVFADKNVGAGKTVSVSGYSLSGTDAGNYVVVQPSGLSADITPANLTVSGVTANNKVYDTTTAATLAGTASVSALGSDAVSVSGAGAGNFADKNVGTSKSVTVSGYTLTGTDAGNYVVLQPSGLNADITAAALTVSGVTADSKVYDATTVASFSTGSSTLAGVIGGDTVSLSSITGSFSDKNVGKAKAVMVAGVGLAGTDAGNYTLAKPSGLSADITPASLTVSATDQSKTQGDTLVFAGTEFTSSGLVGGETIGSVTLTSAGAPAPAPMGSYSVTPSAAVAGAGFIATNYAISYAPATLLVAAAPTAPPAPAPAPAPIAGPAIDHIVALGVPLGLAAASIAEMSASPLATSNTSPKEEQEQAGEPRSGKDNLVDDNQCRR